MELAGAGSLFGWIVAGPGWLMGDLGHSEGQGNSDGLVALQDAHMAALPGLQPEAAAALTEASGHWPPRHFCSFEACSTPQPTGLELGKVVASQLLWLLAQSVNTVLSGDKERFLIAT